MPSKKTKILILGADGFIGSNMAASLCKEKKYELIAFDLFPNGKSRNLEDIRSKIKIIPGNFLNRDDLRKALQGADYVFHFISQTTPGSSALDPFIEVDTNLRGTLVLLEECAKAGVKKIIYSSTGGAIYGDQKKDAYSENNQTSPVSPYAITKLTIEKYLEYYRINFGLEYLILRYSNPYGPHQNLVGTQGIIPIFLNLVKRSMLITIFGDGKNIRDFIFIDDLVEITKKIFRKKTKYNLYNVGSGTGNSINDIVEIIEKVTGKNLEVDFMPQRSIDVRRIVLDTQRLKREIGKYKKVSLEEGIKKTWKWVQRQN
jgi:UDP-glucose 4-epimerase